MKHENHDFRVTATCNICKASKDLTIGVYDSITKRLLHRCRSCRQFCQPTAPCSGCHREVSFHPAGDWCAVCKAKATGIKALATGAGMGGD